MKINFTLENQKISTEFQNMFQLMILQHKIIADHTAKAAVEEWQNFPNN